MPQSPTSPSAGAEPSEDEQSRRLIARIAIGGAAAVVVAIPFTLLMALVLSEWEPLEDLDQGVANSLNGVARGSALLVNTLDVAAVVFTPWVFRVLVLAVAVWLWRRGARRLAAWAVTTAAIGGVLGVLLKLVVERSRPSFPEPVASAGGYSFPSGHALNSMLCVGILVLVFLPVLERTGRVVAYTVGALVVLLTGYDRIALGVHYVSDVVAGWVVALGVLAGTAGAFEIWRRERGLRPSPASEGVQPEAAPSLGE